MSLTAVWERLARDESASVAVVGDIMLDRYLVGESERISPEGPVPVVLVESEMARLGGSGNVVANLRGLGVQALAVGVVGSDLAGRDIRRRLNEMECSTDGLLEHSDRQTTEKTRIFARNQQVVRIDREESGEYEPEVYRSLIEGAEVALGRADILILSDYGKGVCTRTFTRDLIDLAEEASVPVVVDPKGRDFEKYRAANCIAPNLKEIGDVVRLEGRWDEAVIAAARELSRRFAIPNVLVTRSAQGMSLLEGDEPHHFRAQAQEVYDVSGAGDTVVATMAAALACGSGYPEAAALANLAAGIVVGKLGTAPVERREIERRISSRGARSRPGTIAPLEEWLDASESASRWWGRDDRVVLLDGFVDVVNTRTVRVLERAAEEGDVLVVLAWPEGGSDEPRRSTNAVDHRVLAGIAAVDAVMVLDGRRSADQIGRLHPDVVVRSDCFDARPSDLSGGFVDSVEVICINSEGDL